MKSGIEPPALELGPPPLPNEMCQEGHVAREGGSVNAQHLVPLTGEQHGGGRTSASGTNDDGIIHGTPPGPLEQSLPTGGACTRRGCLPGGRVMESANGRDFAVAPCEHSHLVAGEGATGRVHAGPLMSEPSVLITVRDELLRLERLNPSLPLIPVRATAASRRRNVSR
jgi:hypothetical protein